MVPSLKENEPHLIPQLYTEGLRDPKQNEQSSTNNIMNRGDQFFFFFFGK